MRWLAVISLLLLASAPTGATATDGWREYRDRAFGWRISYPADLQLSRFEGFNRITWYGVAVSNVIVRPPSTWPLQAPSLPPHGVLVRFWYQEGGPHHHPNPRDDRLPVSPRRLRSLPFGTRPRARFASLQFGGTPVSIAVWTGPRATPSDVSAAEQVVRRFRPPRLKTGGVTRPCELFVLERVPSYAPGTARRYDAADLPENGCLWRRPFYVVKTRTALYAVGWPPDSRSRGYKNCGVSFDERRFEFFCPNGARWDRFGRVLAVPRSWRGAPDPLARYTLVRAYDRHVLVTTNSYRYPRPH
jgi:hypothetical protein